MTAAVPAKSANDPAPEMTARPRFSTAIIDDRKIEEMDAYLAAVFDTGRFSGNAVVFHHPTSQHPQGAAVTRSYGLANREHGVANTPETKFRIGSVTKQFTAAAILQLQEAGLLDLHAPIGKYLPDYPAGDRITAHHLLAHTAGIPEYLDGKVFSDITEWMRLPATLEQLVARFQDLPLDFEPGKHFKYSNSGYVLLTQLLETLSGQPYADYVQTHLFEPLGMDNTGYELPRAVIPQLAQGYIFIGPDTYLQAEPIDMSLPQGAGGLYSTLADLMAWNAWLYGSHADEKILNAAAVKQLLNPVIFMDLDRDGPDARYGYGLVHDSYLNRVLVHHNGGIPGFRSVLAYYPEAALTISVLTNFENTAPEEVAKTLAAIVFGEPYELPKVPEAIALDLASYARYAGTYQLLPELSLALRIENGQLVGQATGQDAFVLYPTSETDFFAKVVDMNLTFSLAADGSVEGLTLRQLGQELFAPKVV